MNDSQDTPAETARSAGRATRAPEHWILLTMAVAALVGLIVLGVFVAPDERGYGTHEQLGLPACGVMKVTGVPCPGCGVTTSVALAASGRLSDSFVNQPFGLFSALLGAFLILYAFGTHLRGGDLSAKLRGFRMKPWAITIAVLMAVSWVYKIVQVL